ncbi:uncharacterized protein EAE97_011735 [Botrytis byssoidea]|uniref:Uncharacterized protein n=1 Tax=Botrytis byssoidea TaxID=139641 RepID=A0A9P5HPG2_9HELO|nr:uncharacterized protein EAE97_011735 [Botrytis byssoidea]KAF7919019.1 hypothetical protein EAE97_011735 [Botrytis byssoidea]
MDNITQTENEPTSPNPLSNVENSGPKEDFAGKSSLPTGQPNDNSPLLASNSAHHPPESSLPELEFPIRIIQRQLVQSCAKPPRSNLEHLDLQTRISSTHNPSQSPQELSFFPLEYPPYPTSDVNFDEWTNYAAYCGTSPEPELLNLLSNEENASLHKKYFTPRSIDDVNNEDSSSCANKITMRSRTHDFEVTTAQPQSQLP